MCFVFFFKQKKAYEMRISDWSSDVCSSDLIGVAFGEKRRKLRIFDKAERLVVALPLLVLDHVALVIELFLRHRAQQMAHTVGFEEQRQLQRAGQIGRAHV